MEGIITEVHDGSVAIDLKGRLGSLRIPMRMLISEYPLQAGQEVAWNMSFIEQLGEQVNETYVHNRQAARHRQGDINREEIDKKEDL